MFVSTMYTVYGKKGCSLCGLVKEALRKRGLPYVSVLVGDDSDCQMSKSELEARLARPVTKYPVVCKDGVYVGTYKETIASLCAVA